jgi:FG-GAP-like repeat
MQRTTLSTGLLVALAACVELDPVPASRDRTELDGLEALDLATLDAMAADGSYPDGSYPGGVGLDTPWERHAISPGSSLFKGADGVYLADIDGDERLDVVSGHEQSHRVSVSLHPGFDQADAPWPTVAIPPPGVNMPGPEDAAFADVDGDGFEDIIVGGEGSSRVWVLFSPSDLGSLQTASAWTRTYLDASLGMRAMRVVFEDVAGDSTPEIVVGGKEGSMTDAAIGYYSSPTPRIGSSWVYTSIRPVGWVMQMYVKDVDLDGDRDIVYTDRERIDVPAFDNSAMGLRWLESSGGDSPTWTEHTISGSELEHKWFDLADWDDDGDLDIVDCRSSYRVEENSMWLNGGDFLSWTEVPIAEPSGVGECQHMTVVDVDEDGTRDLGISYSHADGFSGVIWLRNAGTHADPIWERGEIAGSAAGDGIKFDNLVWYDIDDDGDLDVVTSEQHEPAPPGPGLGVIWYENPLLP